MTYLYKIIWSGIISIALVSVGQALTDDSDGENRPGVSAVFATLGEINLTQAHLDAFIRDRVPEKYRAGFLSSPDRIADMVQQQLLRRQLGSLAISHGLDKDPDTAALLEYKAMGELANLETQRYLEEHRLESYAAQAQELALVEPELVPSARWKATFDQVLIANHEDESRLDTAVRMADLYERYREGGLDFDALIKHSDRSEGRRVGV